MSKLLILSLCLNFIFILFFICKRFYYAHSHEWGLKKLDKIRSLPISTSSIVFVGDSLTEGFPVVEMFPKQKVKNCGIRGDTSKDVLARITSIAEVKPRKIFLDVGINDILRNIPLDTLFINYKHVVQIIKSNSPNTQIFVQSLLPVGEKYQSFRPEIWAFNETLKNFCHSDSITFINLFPLFYNNGLDPYYSSDSLHLNNAGYEVWRNAIFQYVN